MTSTTIQKSAKLERVRERLFSAVSRLEQAIDDRLKNVDAGDDNSLQAELQRLRAENAALREASAETDTLQAENLKLRDTNAEAVKRVEQTIQALSRALNE